METNDQRRRDQPQSVNVRRKKAPTRVWRPAFLKAFAQIGNLTAAAAAAGVTRWAVEKAMKRSPSFLDLVNKAKVEATERLEAIAWTRATRSENPSDLLTIFLLKALKPEMYRENFRVEASGPGGGPIQQHIEGAVVILPSERSENFDEEASRFIAGNADHPIHPAADRTADGVSPLPG